MLVVDDDQPVCMTLTALLEADGFAVTYAVDDQAAYDALRQAEGAFAALLIDINLGAGTTGFDVARYGRRLMPDVPVIFISGLGEGSSVARFGVHGAVFITKPFDASELRKALVTVRSAKPSRTVR